MLSPTFGMSFSPCLTHYIYIRLTSELWVGEPASGEPYPPAPCSAHFFRILILISDSGSAFWSLLRSLQLANDCPGPCCLPCRTISDRPISRSGFRYFLRLISFGLLCRTVGFSLSNPPRVAIGWEPWFGPLFVSFPVATRADRLKPFNRFPTNVPLRVLPVMHLRRSRAAVDTPATIPLEHHPSLSLPEVRREHVLPVVFLPPLSSFLEQPLLQDHLDAEDDAKEYEEFGHLRFTSSVTERQPSC